MAAGRELSSSSFSSSCVVLHVCVLCSIGKKTEARRKVAWSKRRREAASRYQSSQSPSWKREERERGERGETDVRVTIEGSSREKHVVVTRPWCLCREAEAVEAAISRPSPLCSCQSLFLAPGTEPGFSLLDPPTGARPPPKPYGNYGE